MSNENFVTAPTGGSDGFMANLLQNAAHNAPAIPDDMLVRYGMSFLLPLPLLQQKGANFIGDFHPKLDGRNSGNSENINYYPAFELIAFYGGATDIPFEKNPSFVNEMVKPEPFDFGGFQTNTQAGYATLTRTPKECALIAMSEFKDAGYKQFTSLTGFHATDPDMGLAACDKLIQLILPLRDEKIFPRGMETARVKNGVRFDAPFLDQMHQFILREAMKRIMSAGLKPATFKVAEALYKEIRDGVSSGLKLANTILNETEAEMKNPKGVKKSYDEPNLSVDDAPVATDLYCLAHTDRTELDDKQLAAGANIGKEIAASVSEAFSGLKDFVGGNVPSNLPAKGDVLTNEEVQVMLDQQRETMEEMMREQMQSFMEAVRAGSQTPDETPVDETAPEETTVAENKTVTEDKTKTSDKSAALRGGAKSK